MMNKLHAGLAAVLCMLAGAGQAQQDASSYPQQPIKLMVPWPPGGGVDTTARMIADPLAARLKQPFVIDNRGSSNRGVAFEKPIYRAMGTVEVEDQKAGAEYLKTLDFVDPDKIAIYGWSYGGYMTLKQFEADPGLYAAGIAGAPVTTYVIETDVTISGSETGSRHQVWWYAPSWAMPVQWSEQIEGRRSGAAYSEDVTVTVTSRP